MKIKTTINRETRGKKNPVPDKKPARRKPAVNQKTRLSGRSGITAAFRFLGRVTVPALLAIFVLIFGMLALGSDVFDLNDVRISGYRYQNAVSLENIIREEFPANILRIDLDGTRQRLEREAWVKRVKIRRVLPSLLVLHVEEREPTVLLELGGVTMMADDEGVLLGAYGSEFGKIDSPIFKGFDGGDSKAYKEHYKENAERIRRGIAMLTEIAGGMPQAVRDISEVDISELNNIKIMMDNDPVEISLGGENYLRRFSGFMEDPTRKYQELRNQGVQVAQIDLSNDGQIVYKSPEAVARERTMKLGSSVNR